MLKIQNDPVVSKTKATDVIGEIDKDNLFIANKVISSRTPEDTSLVIGKQKDLVYRLNDQVYLTLTDFNRLNEQFVVRRGINDLFDLDQYKRYVETNGVMTFAGRLDLNESQEDFIYLTSIQGLLEYGINYHKDNYAELLDELRNVNRFLKKYYKNNLRDSSINPDCVKENYVRANQYDLVHMQKALNEDNLNNELSLLYDIKKHRM